jgi:hypothetical protein
VLKRRANLIGQQRFRLRDLLRYNLQTVRAYLLKEDFQQFWEYESPSWAGKFLDEWCCQVMRSRIEPMKKIARTLRSLRIPLILISHSGRSRSPIPVILITLFTMPEEGTADSMTWRWTATTDG